MNEWNYVEIDGVSTIILSRLIDDIENCVAFKIDEEVAVQIKELKSKV